MIEATHRASYDFSDPTEESTLELVKGDDIQVKEEDKGENWWYGRNLRTGKEGYFPPKFVSEMPKPKPKRKKKGDMSDLEAAMAGGGGPPPPPPEAMSVAGSRINPSRKMNYNNDGGQNMTGSKRGLWKGLGPMSPTTQSNQMQSMGETNKQPFQTYEITMKDTESTIRDVMMTNPGDGIESMKQPLIKGKDIFIKNKRPDWGKDFRPVPGRYSIPGKTASEYRSLADDFATDASIYRFAVMAYYMGLYACIFGVAIGAAFFMSNDPYMFEAKGHPKYAGINYLTWQKPFDDHNLLIIIFSMAACPILFIFEYFVGLSPHVDTWAQFAIVYFAVSVPFYTNLFSSLTGILFTLTGIFKLLARYFKEKPPRYKKKKKKKCCSMSVGDCTFGICKMIRRSYWHLAGLYLLTQAGIIAERLHYWIPIWRHDPHTYTLFFVLAKVSGTLLDMNGAFILLPMCRTMIRGLYNLALHNKCLSFFLKMFSLDTMLSMHMLMAFVIFVAALAHTFGHFANYAVVGWDVYKIYGVQIWVNGFALLIIMQLIYCSAPAIIRRDNFEQFLGFHHLFIAFEILLIFHGKNYLGPNYYKWIIVPGFFYMLERILRVRRSASPVGVVSVTHMENTNFKCLCLELEKTGPLASFFEGQYVQIKCQTVSKSQWHPFTISSAPQNETVTLHIRNMGENSWTDQLQTYMKALAPMANKGRSDKNFYFISHLNGKGERVPQVNGPDGKPIIQIDGPHAAPTQHIAEYDRVMVIGSGIGVTPLRASLESVIHHRFKYAVGNARPDHAYFYWIVSWKVVEGFCFMIRSIKEACDEWNDFTIKEPHNMYQKTFEMHVFVTSPPPPQSETRKAANTRATLAMPERMNRNAADDRHIWGPKLKRAGRRSKVGDVAKHPVEWNEWQLFEIMKDPPTGDETYQWGPLIIHGGRPKWEREFQYVTDQTNMKEKGEKWSTGVMFCGNPLIAKDLDKQCTNFTKNGNKFRLHKENF